MRRDGFTLIELLVVMGIMVLLAGLIFSGMWGMVERGRNEEAHKTAVKVAADVGRFRFVYNTYPWDTPISNAQFVEFDWKKVCKELDPTNEDLAGQPEFNKDLRQFMDFTTRNRIKDGVVLDPWGRPYRIGWERKSDQVVVWSGGSDGQDDTFDDLQSAGDGKFGDDKSNL